ncbi:hypothetical protein ACUXCC_003691 [Cytobacillus horneckiae]|uniref:hypothetical protein n=1 Tax=Cytobacillus horneckiae TaxID=549687 RepID=UPI000A3E2BBD|nr:hypothetical protein [Cytobacillus horneckiae]MBN6888729.1 hypothetical protein [Cytobacillus horneckiae]MEC1153989.1 hypothetical protein [Cytobacillus horneckiae]MED2938564.1 hypothetical protein [Cytobacillus horneckiae]
MEKQELKRDLDDWDRLIFRSREVYSNGRASHLNGFSNIPLERKPEVILPPLSRKHHT